MTTEPLIGATLTIRCTNADRILSLVQSLVRAGMLETVVVQARSTRAVPQPTKPRLSPTEWQMLVLAGRGVARAGVADATALSPTSVSTYWQRIYNKLGVNTRAEALAWLRAYERDARNRQVQQTMQEFEQLAETVRTLGVVIESTHPVRPSTSNRPLFQAASEDER